MGTLLSAVGDEKAAYRSAGSYLGEKFRDTRVIADEALGVIPGLGRLSRNRQGRRLYVEETETGVLDNMDLLKMIPHKKY